MTGCPLYMILMHLCEFLIVKIMMDEIRKKGPQWQKNLENGLYMLKKLNTIAVEDQENGNQNQTGNVYTTR